MSARIVNLSNGHRYKFNQTLRLIEQCAVEWVVYGVSVRKLEVAEMVKARSEQAKMREPLAYAEVHGLRYDPAASGVVATRLEKRLIFEAHRFVAEQAA